MTRAWGLLPFVAWGCAPSQPAVPDASVPCPPFVVSEGLLESPVPPGLLGQPMTLPFGVLLQTCDQQPFDERVTASAQVLDPSNQAIASVVDAGTSGLEFATSMLSQGSIEDDVTFTPHSLGPYHVSLRFEPNGGVLQADVQVGVDRRPGSYEPLPMPPECADLAFSPGYELCLEQRTLYLLDGGITLDTIDAVAFGVSDGYLWSVDEPESGPVLQLDRLDPTLGRQRVGTYLLNAMPIGQTANLILGTVVASGPRVLLVAPPYLQEAWFDGQVVDFEPAWTLPMTLPVAVQWAPDAGAVIAGTVGFDGGSSDGVCVVRFSSGYQCQPVMVLGGDGQRVWTAVGNDVTAWTVGDDAGVSTVSAPFIDATALKPMQSGGKLFGPAIHDPWPFGVELFELGPEPRLAVYGQSTFESSTPASWGFSAEGYWEWYSDGRLVLLAR